MTARLACVNRRKPKGDLSNVLEQLGIRTSQEDFFAYLRSPGGMFAAATGAAVLVLNPAGLLGLSSLVWRPLVSFGVSFLASSAGVAWERRHPSGKIANVTSVTTELRREADKQGFSFYYNAMPILLNKASVFESHGIKIAKGGSEDDLWSSMMIKMAALHDKNSLEMSSRFFYLLYGLSCNIKEEVGNVGGLLGTPYRCAASDQFEGSVQSIIKRGLSSLLDCNDPTGAAEQFLNDLQHRGPNRSLPEHAEINVMYIAVSYRYVYDKGLTADMWREAVVTMTQIGQRLGYDHIRIWVDKLSITEGMDWSAVGFLPYLIFPTFLHPNARGDSNRLWIELEKLAASLGPGILTEDTTEDDVIEHLAISRSPAECLMSFAEVLVSGCLDEIKVKHEDDRCRMKQWAKALLTTSNVNQMFTMPRYDLEGRSDTRHDASMLCLFDDDLMDIYAVRAYIDHTNSQMQKRCRQDGEEWNGMLEALGCSNINNSEAVKELVEKTAFVLHRPNQTTSTTAVCWYVVCTMRGKVIVEVALSGTAGTDIREWHVTGCKRLKKADIDASYFAVWFLLPTEGQQFRVIPHEELKWVWKNIPTPLGTIRALLSYVGWS